MNHPRDCVEFIWQGPPSVTTPKRMCKRPASWLVKWRGGWLSMCAPHTRLYRDCERQPRPYAKVAKGEVMLMHLYEKVPE